MEQRNPRLRWLVVWILAVVWMAAVVARLSYLQLFCYGEYLAKAQRQQQRIFEISPMRGTISDRKGRELAVSLPMDSVFGDPAEINDVPMVARLLSRALDLPAEEIQTKIDEAHTPVRLAKKLSPEIVQRITDMNLRGVFFQKENRRVYPQHELAASVLGYVDVDEKGIGGIEYALDKQIRGRPGRIMVMADGRRRWYDRNESQADPGASVQLTIDETIQYIAEKELAKAIADTHAKGGSIVVQDPNTGELLAVANWPVFDPNNAGAYPDAARIDRAVSSAYEPGSIFKVITMTGAIENGVARPDELIDCQMGKILVAGRVIHDWKPFGVLSLRGVLANSSDVGSIKVALRMGSPKFYDVIRSFGIGQPTGIALPGENRGLLRPLENWSANSIGSLAMGQEVSVTPIQIVSAISAIANGGTLYPPRILSAVNGQPMTSDQPNLTAAPRDSTDARTAAEIREMMEDVMIEGTGKHCQLDGYTSGGKSGTAQKIDPANGRYSRTDYNASFIGFAPVNDPAVSILVVLDSPVGAHHGGEVSGPVFKRVAEQVLAYKGVPHDVASPSDVETAQNSRGTARDGATDGKKDAVKGRSSGEQANEQVEVATKARFDAAILKRSAGPLPERIEGQAARDAAGQTGSQAGSQTVAFGEDRTVAVPSLEGQGIRSVTEACSRLGLIPALIGNGVGLEQFPPAGAQVLQGSRVTVRFGRPGLMPAAAQSTGEGASN
jgi:cell division protein FtsI (penicillin-binding protein 3)